MHIQEFWKLCKSSSYINKASAPPNKAASVQTKTRLGAVPSSSREPLWCSKSNLMPEHLHSRSCWLGIMPLQLAAAGKGWLVPRNQETPGGPVAVAGRAKGDLLSLLPESVHNSSEIIYAIARNMLCRQTWTCTVPLMERTSRNSS